MRGQHCRAQQRQSRRGEQGTLKIRAWISCHSRLRVAQEGVRRSQIQCHRRRNGRSRTPEGTSNCLLMLADAAPLWRLTSDSADLVNDIVNHLLPDCVVTTGICISQQSLSSLLSGDPTIVGRIFLAADQKLGMEQLAVVPSADLINWLRTLSISIQWVGTGSPKGPGRRKSSGGHICRWQSR